jgi:type VI secretion system secreted protein VgrG
MSDKTIEKSHGDDDLDRLKSLRSGEPQLIGGVADVKLTIDGKEMKADIYYAELEQTVDGHHELKITLRELGQVSKDHDFTDVSKYTSFLGKSLSLTTEVQIPDRSAPVKASFVGLVTRIDLENSIMGINVVTLIGHSPTIQMDGAKKNAFYRDMSASDIVGSIVGNYQITRGNIDSSPGSLKLSVQYRETDYQYIMRLATGAGMFAYYDGREFRVTKANSNDSEDLAWRGELGAFTLGLGTAPCEFNTQVYNYEQKKTFTQDSKSISSQASLSDLSKISPDASKKLYGDSGFSSSATTVEDAQSLDHTLQSDRSRALGQMILGRGQSIIPTVAAGHAVKIKGLDRMDGTYWVLKVKHIFDPSHAGYYNTFECVPLDIAFPQYKASRPTITNIQMGVVVDNNDPEKLGRLKVKFPWCESDATPWVRLMTPHAGSEHGWYCLPEINDEVLVGYEQGSPDLPVVLGALYNKDDAPPGDAVDPDNNVKMFMTRSGNKIVFTDKDGGEEIQIITGDGKNLITMKSGGPTVIESDGALNFKGGGDIKIEGNNITIESQAEIKIKAGSNAKLEGAANVDVKAGAQLQLQGTLTAVKGTPIQLN